ncbi:MAG: DegT/DnrJ/EryC1/StrS family aminotransferase [Planctomycetota bacterium]
MTERIYLSPPDVGPEERALLLDAFDSNWIAPLGPHVDAFEREVAQVAGVAHGAALSSGTAALHLALLLLGVGPGDVVLTSTLTFTATANAIVYLGAEPVFLDADPATWNLDPALLAEELAERAAAGALPRAVITVDLYGQCADYDAIRAACAPYGIPIVEDAAEALGATYKGRPAGSLGDLGVFSFNGNKIVSTSGGGMLVSERQDWIERARFLASQAKEPAPWFQHEVVGFNYRLSNLLAAVGRGSLRSLERRVARRRAHYEAYRAALADLPLSFMPQAPYGRSTCWLSCALLAEDCPLAPLDVVHSLDREGIEARPLWKPMHLQPVHRERRVRGGEVAERLFARGLCLPSGSSLTDEQRQRVIDALRRLPWRDGTGSSQVGAFPRSV